MKQREKLDYILRALYERRTEQGFIEIEKICSDIDENISSSEIGELVERLKNQGLINAIFTSGNSSAKLTSEGIEYCEGDSFSEWKNSQHSPSTVNVFGTVVNGSNINVVTGNRNNVSSGSNNTFASGSGSISINSIPEYVLENLNKIRDGLDEIKDLDLSSKEEILECIEDIREKIESKGKIGKYLIKSLLDYTSKIASIGSFAVDIARGLGYL